MLLVIKIEESRGWNSLIIKEKMMQKDGNLKLC